MDHIGSRKIEQAAQKPEKLWAGDPGICDICSCILQRDFYDARTFAGPWATLCQSCWREHTTQQLGTGLGQHYQRRWVKVEG